MSKSPVHEYQITARGGSHTRREYEDGTPVRKGDGGFRRSRYVTYNYDRNRVIRLTEDEAQSKGLAHLKLVLKASVDRAAGTIAKKDKGEAEDGQSAPPATDIAADPAAGKETPKEPQGSTFHEEGTSYGTHKLPDGTVKVVRAGHPTVVIPTNWRIMKTDKIRDLAAQLGAATSNRAEALAAIDDVWNSAVSSQQGA